MKYLLTFYMEALMATQILSVVVNNNIVMAATVAFLTVASVTAWLAAFVENIALPV
jgi:hypothetical protein